MNKPTVTVTPDDGRGHSDVIIKDDEGLLSDWQGWAGYPVGTVPGDVYALLECIAELEAERDQLKRVIESFGKSLGATDPSDWVTVDDAVTALLYGHDQLREQNEALAAHVERIRESAFELVKVPKDALTIVGNVRGQVSDAPQTSLAQRDALMKESTARELAMRWPPDSVMRSRLLEFADEYRQQAEGGE